MPTEKRHAYTAKLHLRQRAQGGGYKYAVCTAEFTSKLAAPEITGVDILHVRESDTHVPEFLSRSVKTLGLSTRAMTVLANFGIETVEDLASMQPYELFKCKGAGETVLRECAGALTNVGLALGCPPLLK